MMGSTSSARAGVAVVQGVYYGVTGVWPLLHMRSFEAVTGPKVDGWLVKTVGALVGVVGASCLVAARRGEVSASVAVLGAGSAAALGAVDAWYAVKGRVRGVYLLDAVGEAVLVAAWLWAWRRG